MSVLLEFSVLPIGKGESISEPVAHTLECVEDSGLPYKVGPMGTTVETRTVGQAFRLVERCLEGLQQECHRIQVTMSLDWRSGDESRLEANVSSVEAKVGHALHR